MMSTSKILESLRYNYPELLTADGFDDALIGIVDGWFGNSQRTVACYDFGKCVDILMERDHMDQDEAVEFMDFNVVGAYVGESTPVFLHDWRKEEP
jgi:hypothetical protein